MRQRQTRTVIKDCTLAEGQKGLHTSEEESPQKLGRRNALRLGRVVEGGSSIRPPRFGGLLDGELVANIETKGLGDAFLVLHHRDPTRGRIGREGGRASMGAVCTTGNRNGPGRSGEDGEARADAGRGRARGRARMEKRHEEIWLVGIKFLLVLESFGRTDVVLLFELGNGRG